MTIERMPIIHRLPDAPMGTCATCGYPLQYEREAYRGRHRGLYCEGWLDGLDEMARTFWAAVCEQRACRLEDRVHRMQTGREWGASDVQKQVRRYVREIARFRAWAKEGA